MSQSVFQPVGQKRLTNVAVVRLKKAGKRFEIACYKNKVRNWRQGVESDLDEVLQTTEVFQNVSKGQFAQNEDLVAAFGTADKTAICREILAKGDVQVSDKERKVELDALFKDVASMILEKCVNPETSRPFTMGLIERGLKDIHFAVDPKRSAKQQALEAIPLLQQKFPIERAMMRVDISVPVANKDELTHMLDMGHGAVEHQDLVEDVFKTTCLIQPGSFRSMYNYVSQQTEGKGRLEVVAVAVHDAAVDTTAGGAAGAATRVAAVGGGVAAAVSERDEAPAARAAPERLAGGFAMSTPSVVIAPVARQRGEPTGKVVFERACISEIPDQWENRREMFKELDALQPGWMVELRARGGGDTVDAVFYSPTGDRVGTFAAARRQAMQAAKAA